MARRYSCFRLDIFVVRKSIGIVMTFQITIDVSWTLSATVACGPYSALVKSVTSLVFSFLFLFILVNQLPRNIGDHLTAHNPNREIFINDFKWCVASSWLCAPFRDDMIATVFTICSRLEKRTWTNANSIEFLRFFFYVGRSSIRWNKCVPFVSFAIRIDGRARERSRRKIRSPTANRTYDIWHSCNRITRAPLAFSLATTAHRNGSGRIEGNEGINC